GYSSLGYLHRLPVDAVKIDRSFVEQLGTGDPRASVVPTVIRLAGSFGLHVIAEGLETTDQYRELARLGCASAQGYMVSPPIPAEEIAGVLQRETGAWRTASAAVWPAKFSLVAAGSQSPRRARRPSLINIVSGSEAAFPMIR